MSEDAGVQSSDLFASLHASLDALEEIKADYALVGGLAVSAYGLPRLTYDVDLVVRVAQVTWPRLLDGLVRRGYALSAPGAAPRSAADVLTEIRSDSMTQLWHGRFRLDLLQAADPLHTEALTQRRELPFEGRLVPVVRPEHLLVMKWIAGRPKDLLDVDGILSELGRELDLGMVRVWLPAIENGGGLTAAEFEDRVRRLARGA